MTALNLHFKTKSPASKLDAKGGVRCFSGQ
jgi:hypothetical protein